MEKIELILQKKRENVERKSDDLHLFPVIQAKFSQSTLSSHRIHIFSFFDECFFHLSTAMTTQKRDKKTKGSAEKLKMSSLSWWCSWHKPELKMRNDDRAAQVFTYN